MTATMHTLDDAALIERLSQRVANLEGVTRMQREALDRLEKRHDGDLAEHEHKLAKLVASHEGMGEIDAPICGDDRDVHDECSHGVHGPWCRKYIANETALAEALSALRRLCDALGVLPGVGSNEIPGRIDEVMAARFSISERISDWQQTVERVTNERDAIREVVKLIAKAHGFEPNTDLAPLLASVRATKSERDALEDHRAAICHALVLSADVDDREMITRAEDGQRARSERDEYKMMWTRDLGKGRERIEALQADLEHAQLDAARKMIAVIEKELGVE